MINKNFVTIKNLFCLFLCCFLSMANVNIIKASEVDTSSMTLMERLATIKTSDFLAPIESYGDLSRVQTFIRKIQKGGTYNIAVFGGSISAGATLGSPLQSYGQLFTNWLVQNYPNCTFNFINAGYPSTNVTHSSFRINEDLLIHNLDLVVLDFSVNNFEDKNLCEKLESIIFRILAKNNETAIIYLSFTETTATYNYEGDASINEVPTFLTAKDDIYFALEYYAIPSISYHKFVWQEIQNGLFSWEDVNTDLIHPNAYGHDIAANLLSTLIHFVPTNLQPDAVINIPTLRGVEDQRYIYYDNVPDGISVNGTVTYNGFIHAVPKNIMERGWIHGTAGQAANLNIDFAPNNGIAFVVQFIDAEGSNVEFIIKTDGENPKKYIMKSMPNEHLRVIEYDRPVNRIEITSNLAKGTFVVRDVGLMKKP